VVLVAGLGRDRMLARLLLDPPSDQPADAGPHGDDEEDPPDELCEGELPAEEDPEDDPDLEDEVRGGELERHRGGEAGTLLEERLGDRDSGVATGGRSRSEASGERELARPAPTQRTFEALARDPGLDDPGEEETEDERPPDLPRHLECVPEALKDELQCSHTAARRREAPRVGLEPTTLRLTAGCSAN
jgi:hypothetical protein